MRIAFRATEAGFEADDEAMVCGVAGGPDMYLTFQRAIEGSANDDGIYLEHGDQINGQYGCKPTHSSSPNNAMDSDTVRSPLRAPHGARHRER